MAWPWAGGVGTGRGALRYKGQWAAGRCEFGGSGMDLQLFQLHPDHGPAAILALLGTLRALFLDPPLCCAVPSTH